MKGRNLLKLSILVVFLAVVSFSALNIRIETREACAAEDIFIQMDKKLDRVIQAQQQMQADIDSIKAALEEIKSKAEQGK